MTEPTDNVENSSAADNAPVPSRPQLQPRGAIVRHIPAVLRFPLGYIIAIGAGTIVFTLSFQMFINHSEPNLFDKGTVLFFVLGFVLGLPYTVLGSLAFVYVLPRTALSFMLTGILCPSSAIFLSTLGGPGGPLEGAEFLQLGLVSLPAGIISAYLYGAIGFGFGFGRWRIDGQ